MDPTVILDKVYHDILTLPVLWRGLWASVLVSLVCSTLSVYVVLKRLAFIGEGIAHSALGGIALGVLLFVSGPMFAQGPAAKLGVDVTTAVFCLIVAWLIGWTSHKRIISEDAAIGIFFVASMAFGVVLIALRRAYTADLFAFLFGSVLAVTTGDIYITALLAGVILTGVLLFYRQLFLFSLDEELASAAGLPVRLIYYALLSALALTIVISMKVLGVLLVTAFLVIPGATARLLTYHYRNIFILANILGFLAVLGGLMLSDTIEDLPSGPTIVLCQFMMFIIAVLWSRTRARLARGRELTVLGSALVIVVYMGVLYVAASVGYAASLSTGRDSQPPAQTTSMQTTWEFFVSALQARHFDEIQARLEGNPSLGQELGQRIMQLHLTDAEKSQVLDAIYQARWNQLSDGLIQKVSQLPEKQE